MKIAIIDDDKISIEEIRSLLNKFLPDNKAYIDSFQSVREILKSESVEKYDLLFIDIILTHENGIEASVSISKRMPHANIVFISVNPDFFRDVYKVKHSYFLTKPIDEVFFRDALNKAICDYSKSRLAIQFKGETLALKVNSIYYIESVGRNIRIITDDGKSYTCIHKLDVIEKLTPLSEFIRTHKSYLVNPEFIKTLERTGVIMENGVAIPISRTYSKTAKDKLAEFLAATF